MRSNFRKRSTRYGKRTARRGAARKARRAVPRGSSLVKTIKKVLNKSLETKYLATELNSGYVYGNISESYGAGGNPAAGNFMFNLIPRVPQTSATFPETSAHVRIGNRIAPIKMVTTVQFYFQGNGLQSGRLRRWRWRRWRGSQHDHNHQRPVATGPADR